MGGRPPLVDVVQSCKDEESRAAFVDLARGVTGGHDYAFLTKRGGPDSLRGR
jgi:hypothetical protein